MRLMFINKNNLIYVVFVNLKSLTEMEWYVQQFVVQVYINIIQ